MGYVVVSDTCVVCVSLHTAILEIMKKSVDRLESLFHAPEDNYKLHQIQTANRKKNPPSNPRSFPFFIKFHSSGLWGSKRDVFIMMYTDVLFFCLFFFSPALLGITSPPKRAIWRLAWAYYCPPSCYDTPGDSWRIAFRQMYFLGFLFLSVSALPTFIVYWM